MVKIPTHWQEEQAGDLGFPSVIFLHVVTIGVKQYNYWCKDELYEKYAIDLIRKEGVETALERSVTTMMEWADENEPACGIL